MDPTTATPDTKVGEVSISDMAHDIVRFARTLHGNEGYDYAVSCLIAALACGQVDGIRLAREVINS